MSPMVSAAVCLPALFAVLAIGLWVLVDHVQYRPAESGRGVIGEDGRLVPESGPVWSASYPVETPTTELTVVPRAVRSHRAARGWTQ